MEFNLDSLKDLKIVVSLKVSDVQVSKEDNSNRKIADFSEEAQGEIGKWSVESQRIINEIYERKMPSIMNLQNISQSHIHYLWDMMYILTKADYPSRNLTPLSAVIMLGVLGISKTTNFKPSFIQRDSVQISMIISDWMYIKREEMLAELDRLEDYGVLESEEVPESIKENRRYSRKIYSLNQNMLRFFNLDDLDQSDDEPEIETWTEEKQKELDEINKQKEKDGFTQLFKNSQEIE